MRKKGEVKKEMLKRLDIEKREIWEKAAEERKELQLKLEEERRKFKAGRKLQWNQSWSSNRWKDDDVKWVSVKHITSVWAMHWSSATSSILAR